MKADIRYALFYPWRFDTFILLYYVGISFFLIRWWSTGSDVMWPSADVLSQLLCAHNFVVLFCVLEWLVNLLLLVWFIPTGFPIQKLQSRVLHLHVFDYDRFSRDDSIGEVFLPLCQVLVDWLISLKNAKCILTFFFLSLCVCVWFRWIFRRSPSSGRHSNRR